MEEDKRILQDIGSIKCKKCGGICLVDLFTSHFVCQECWTRYVLLKED